MGVKELTIVIPSYNTASFMEKNVQTMIHDELLNSMEILIINDGSKDNTLETAYKLQKKYPNCIRVVNKPNGGHGSVINKGIEEATGRYFKVIDGDDYVDTHELIKFVSTLKTIDDDCILSMYNTVSAVSGEIKIQNPYIKSALILNNKSYSTETILPSITATIHAITYKTELLKNHLDQIKVLEGVFYEDMEFVTYPIVYCESIYISDAIVYIRNINNILTLSMEIGILGALAVRKENDKHLLVWLLRLLLDAQSISPFQSILPVRTSVHDKSIIHSISKLGIAGLPSQFIHNTSVKRNHSNFNGIIVFSRHPVAEKQIVSQCLKGRFCI